MADRQRPAGAEEATPFEGTQAFNRRLADKIRDAIAQAIGQGRDEVAERLRAIHDEIVEQERIAFAGTEMGDRRGG
ncbi:MAG: hypothetical protein ACE5LF_06505 [Alphaproteobacteria bacterium]